MTRLGVHVAGQLTELLAPLGIQPRHFGRLSLLNEEDGRSQLQLAEALNLHRNVMVEAKLLGGPSAEEAAVFVELQRRVSEHAGISHEPHPGLRGSLR
jgi:hypothetical protein